MDYSTIQQHQPLRTPSSFDAQGKAFVAQLEEVLDDIYRRFGRLRMEDMGVKFQQRFTNAEGKISEFEIDINGLTGRVSDAEGNISTLTLDVSGLTTRVGTAEGNITTLTLDVSGLTTRVGTAEGNISTLTLDVSGLTTRVGTAEGDISTLQVNVGNLTLAVADKYGKVSGISIDSNGIDISGSKFIRIESGCALEIKTGGTMTLQSGQFSIDASGNATFAGTMSAACITSGTLSANYIKGGTLVLGGDNNENGILQIKNASGTVVGTLNKDGLSFSSSLSITSGGTFLVDATNFKVDSANKILKTGDWQLSENGLSGIIGSTSSRVEFSIEDRGDGLGYRIKSKFGNGTVCALGITSDGFVGSKYNFLTPLSTSSVDLGSSLCPWANAYADNVYCTNLYGEYSGTSIHFYPNRSSNTHIGFSEYTNNGNTYAQIYASNAFVRLSVEAYDVYYTNLIQQSSRDVKHDIRTLASKGDQLDRLTPVTFVYDRDTDEKQRVGLIYEDTVDVMPEICTCDESNKAINYVELIPILLKEIQDLRARVSELEGGQEHVQSD